MNFSFNGLDVCFIIIVLVFGNWTFIGEDKPTIGILCALTKDLHKKLLADPESINILILIFLLLKEIINVVVIVVDLSGV